MTICAYYFDERDDGEDCVEGGEDEEVDEGVHIEEAAVSRHELDCYCGNDDYRYHPSCEIPPCAEDFFLHAVGGEGEEEDRRKNKGDEQEIAAKGIL